MTNDYELVYLAQENNEEARHILHKKYSSFIYCLIDKAYKKYNFITTDIDDVKLECIFILDNAINNYNQDREAKFSSYVKICIETKLKDVIKSNLTKKRKIENNIISLDEEIKGIKRQDLIFDNKALVSENYFDIDNFIKIVNKNLSNNEREILILLLKGKKIDEIAILLNIETKKIRNTIYRIKTKLKERLC